MADERAERPARMSAQELVARILAEHRAKAPRAGAPRVYEDEPIIKTGAQFVRDRQRREERDARSKAAYVHQASSREDASWRELMAYGTVRRFEGDGTTAGEPSRENGALRDADGERSSLLRGEGVPEWRRPAREAALADFSLERDAEKHFGVGAAPEPSKPVELPPLLQELRALEREDAAFLGSRDWLFVRQAKLAVDYEDDFAYEGAFQHYFPTYQAMDDAQLRGYFAWRAKARHGRLERTSLSFAFVRLYELLNGVGSTSPEEGFEALRDFATAYQAKDARIERYARTWLHDYVIYHGLDRSLLDDVDGSSGQNTGSARSLDEALAVLAASDSEGAQKRQALGGGEAGSARSLGARGNGDQAPKSLSGERLANERLYGERLSDEGLSDMHLCSERLSDEGFSDERLFASLCALSSYRLDAARFYRDEPELARRAACEAWRSLGAYYRKHRKRTLFESLFGRRFEVPYPMFRSAVFYGETHHADAVYEVSPVRRFVCRGGRWSEEAYHEAKGRSKDLGRVMRALDRTLRRQCGSKHQIKGEPVPKYAQDILDGVVGRLLEERRQAEERARAVRVEIDFSKLRSIRAAAASTREALLIDEERSDGGEGASFGAGSPLLSFETATGATPGGLAAMDGREATPGDSAVLDGRAPAPSALADGYEAKPRDFAASDVRAFAPSGGCEPTPGGLAPARGCEPTSEGCGASLAPSAPNSAGLTKDEVAYLRCLAEGATADERAAVLKRAGVMESLMMDAVNEKLYDLLGDIAIEDTGEEPALVEDYVDDVKGYAGL